MYLCGAFATTTDNDEDELRIDRLAEAAAAEMDLAASGRVFVVLLSTLLLTEFSVNVTDVIICVLPWMEYHKYILFVLGPTNTSASASHCLPACVQN